MIRHGRESSYCVTQDFFGIGHNSSGMIIWKSAKNRGYQSKDRKDCKQHRNLVPGNNLVMLVRCTGGVFLTIHILPGLRRRLFTKLASDVNYMQTIRVFIDHVDSLSSVALEMENDHIAVQHGVLSFFELVPSLTLTYKVPLLVVVPDSTVVYRCFLSDSGMSVSRICGIVYHYKRAFHIFELEQQLQYEQLLQSQISQQNGTGDGPTTDIPVPQIPGYSRDYVGLFNSFVMDICNFLWRNKAFNKKDKNARGFLLEE